MAEGYHPGRSRQNTIRARSDSRQRAQNGRDCIGCAPFPGATLALLPPALAVVRGNLGSLGEVRGIFLAEHLGAEPHRGIDLRLAEGAVATACATQRIEQGAGTWLEKLLQLAEGALRNLVDGKLTGIVAARRDETDQRFGLGHFIGVERGARHNFLGGPRPDQATHTSRHQLDLGSENSQRRDRA